MSIRPTSRLAYLQATFILPAVVGLCWAAGGPIRVSGQISPMGEKPAPRPAAALPTKSMVPTKSAV